MTQDARLPRKLKKRIKHRTGIHYIWMNSEQKLWYFTYLTNPKYHQLLINKILRK